MKFSTRVMVVTATALSLLALPLAAFATDPVADAITSGASSISTEVVSVLPAVIGGSATLFAAFLGIRALFHLFKKAVA